MTTSSHRLITIELSEYDYDFIFKSFRKNLMLKDVLSALESSQVAHPECEEYLLCELAPSAIEVLIGELSYKANHTRSDNVFFQADGIASSLESALRQAR